MNLNIGRIAKQRSWEVADAMKLSGDGNLDYEWIDALNAYPEDPTVSETAFKINADRMEARILKKLAAQGVHYS